MMGFILKIGVFLFISVIIYCIYTIISLLHEINDGAKKVDLPNPRERYTKQK